MSDRFRAVVAVHVLLVRDGQVLLLRRANTGYEDGNYSVPAGHLDGGESATTAAARELREETGLAVAETAFRFAGVMHRMAEEERIDFFFLLDAFEGEPVNAEPAKCGGLRWARPDDLPDNMVPYVREGIAVFLRGGRRYAQFGWE